VHPAKAVGWNEMPFGRDSHATPIPSERGDLGIGTPVKKFTLQVVAKPLQIVELLLYMAYRNSATPYPVVPTPTHMISSSPK